MLALATLLVLLRMRDRPPDVGLLPYGATELPTEAPQSTSWLETLIAPIRVLGQASRSGAFWILFGTFFICGATTTGLVQTHLVSICGDFGIAAVTAAGMLAAERFGPNSTIVFGWVLFGHQIGSAVAAYGAGLTRDVYFTYIPAFFTVGALCLLAALAVFALHNVRSEVSAVTA